MFEKLSEFQEKYDDLSRQLSDPKIAQNQDLYKKLLKEHGKLARIVGLYQEHQRVTQELEEARHILQEAVDSEMAELAKEEISELEAKEHQLAEEMKALLIMSQSAEDPDQLIMEIRAGTGGEEACIFAADLFRMYSRFAEKKRWKLEVMDSSETDMDGYKEIIFSIKGKDAYLLLQYESGGHRVQRVPKTESQGRIHTSAVTVAVLPEVEEIEVQLNPADIKMEAFRASGPGGQHVNKTSSAVRLTHIPTGIVVACQEGKSQHQNRAKAERLLRSRIYLKLKEERDSARGALRKNQIGSGDRSERIRTYNFPQNRVTDHRINFSYYNLQAFLMGDMEIMLEKLQEHFNLLKLKELLT